VRRNLPSIKRRWRAWILAGIVVIMGLALAAGSVYMITRSHPQSESLTAWQASLGIATAIVGGGVVGIVLSIVQHQSTEQIAQNQTKLAHDLQVDLVIQTTKDLSGFDLRNMDLTGMYLTERDFSRAQLGDAHLEGVVLDRSVFANADLTRADLSGASLRFCQFLGTDLTSTTLSGCDLFGAMFSDVDFDETTKWPEGFKAPKKA